MKNSRDLILGEVVYIAIIISQILEFFFNGYDFYFDHMTGENRELTKLYWAVVIYKPRDGSKVHKQTKKEL